MTPLRPRTFIIAEAGVNHNGDRDRALALVDAAAAARADAVKFQTFEPSAVISVHAPKAEYQLSTTESGQSQLEMAMGLKLEDRDFFDLAARCQEKGIAFLSTPFDFGSVDFLIDQMGLTTIKISSGELTNAPLLLRVAMKGVKIILSTGMSDLNEVEDALKVIAFGYTRAEAKPSDSQFLAAYDSEAGKQALRQKVVLLHCTTEYPAPLAETNLKAMDTLRNAFGLPVGFSDHTPGITAAIAAVARGAVVIEKHFTLDRGLPGPDHKASLEPGELAAMVEAIRDTESALGDGVKRPTSSETKNRTVARKSLVARQAIPAGAPFTEENVTVKRPGTGISPRRYWEWMGRISDRDYEADDLIRE